MAENNVTTGTRAVVAPADASRVKQYKAGQGYYTRLGTAVGAAAMVAWGGYYLSNQLSVLVSDDSPAVATLVTVVIPMVLAVLCLGLVGWLVYLKPKTGDFLIATEGEMKKVNWSTRREIIGSTKVVIMFTVLLAVLLFIFDFVFQMLFSGIGILKT